VQETEWSGAVGDVEEVKLEKVGNTQEMTLHLEEVSAFCIHLNPSSHPCIK